MTQAQIIALINSSVVFGTVILFGAVGEILTEKGGNLNLGAPGIMPLARSGRSPSILSGR